MNGDPHTSGATVGLSGRVVRGSTAGQADRGTPVVDLRGRVHRSRKDLPVALDGIDLQVMPGEAFGLVGPDGAGKTTLMRLLCGLLKPSAGDLRVFDEALPAGIDRIKPRIGYVSQRFSLYGDLTIQENLDFFADIHGVRGKVAKERKEALLAFTRLTPFRKRLADRLSGGMRQKLSLICTLVHEPELLLLDEPTTGVDPITRRDFWSILSTLLEQGLTIVMSTPYLDEAERCGRVALVDRGRVLASGTPDQLRRGSTLRVLEVVCSPVRDAADSLAGAPGVADVHSFGDRLHVLLGGDSPAADQAEILAGRLRGQGIEVRAARPVTAGLEDVFIQLVQQGRDAAGPAPGGAP
ncbi:MAG: ABC transporter ATP-binding protein [Myxococcota bacterium]|nr:ABC transporter ATP-binding protein [Myxococcota bacterium]